MSNKIARELLEVAKTLLAFDFATQDALNKYLKEHPDADRSNHKVVKNPALRNPEERAKHHAKQFKQMHGDKAKEELDHKIGIADTSWKQWMNSKGKGHPEAVKRKKMLNHLHRMKLFMDDV